MPARHPSKDDVEEMPQSSRDEDIYQESGREELTEDEDEITPEEEGFMEGYDEEEKAVACANCGRVLVEKEDAIEQEIDGEHYHFCSERCADKYAAKQASKNT